MIEAILVSKDYGLKLWDIPSSWNWKIMKEISIIKSGSTPSTIRPFYWGGEIAWITPDDLSKLKGKYISKGKRNITKKGYENCSTQLLPKGAVILSSRAPIGYVAIASNELCTNQGCKSFILNEDVLSEYVYYYLILGKEFAEKLGSGTTFKEITSKRSELIPIPIPSTYEEQQLIVSEIEKHFSRLDQSIAALKAVKRKLAVYRKSVLKTAFEGKLIEFDKNHIAKLQDIINDICSGYACGKYKISGDGIIHFRPYNITAQGEMSLERKKIVDPQFSLKRLEYGDVVFNNTNSQELVGKTCFYDGKEKVGFSNHMTRIQTNLNRIDPNFLSLYLHQLYVKGFYYSVMKNHVNQSSVGIDILKNIDVPTPSVDIQNKVVQEIESHFSIIDKIEEVVENSLNKAQTLRKAILKQAFEGKLVKVEE
ncbi:MAG: restriction endonuclease subunit S [Candidatus Aenigmarchaeota archaeon]|nr:restriction endonuclease subunit S [Candidatus Aenigmarchaeota archaeon]